MNTGIYIIESPTGKIYVGQSRNLTKRILRYKNLHCKTQTKLYNSLKKHGWVAHKFSIIILIASDTLQSTLDELEQFYMDEVRAKGIELMNLKEGGIGQTTF